MENNSSRREQLKKKKLIYNIIIVICIIALLISGYFIISYFMETNAADSEYESIINDVKNTDSLIGNTEASTSIDFNKLYEINSDVVGWIEIPDTVIDYPIVQGTDNDYYQSHTFKKEKVKSAAIFMDYRNDKNFADKNTVIYGHNMKNGSMFHTIQLFFDQKYYEAHPYVYIYTPDETRYKAEIFTIFTIDSTDKYRTMDFNSDDEFKKLVDEMKSRSEIDINVDVSKNDRIITLSTCHSSNGDKRLVIMAKLTEET